MILQIRQREQRAEHAFLCDFLVYPESTNTIKRAVLWFKEPLSGHCRICGPIFDEGKKQTSRTSEQALYVLKNPDEEQHAIVVM
jgi:hypothetical protein